MCMHMCMSCMYVTCMSHVHMHVHVHVHVYYLQAELAGLFKDNFAKYASECTPEVVACGPKA